MHADVGAVQPVAVGLVRGQPAALDDVGERVVDVVEVEVQPDRRRHADDRVAVERDELALGKQLDVLAIVRRLEPLRVVERRKQIRCSSSSCSACSGLVCITTRPSASRR